jgi:hypothetical protein
MDQIGETRFTVTFLADNQSLIRKQQTKGDTMKNTFFAIFLLSVATIRSAQAQSEILTAFKNSSIECDYLIVTVQDFARPAVALAQHRNSFEFDDVEHAKVAFLPEILAQFPGYDYTQRNIALWKALKWAHENWRVPFKYIVLIGNDSYSIDPNDSTISSNGVIPVWYLYDKTSDVWAKGNFPVAVTDDFYCALALAEPPAQGDSSTVDSTHSIGRIPATTAAQCSIYVEKVKRFDLSRPYGPYRNKVLAIADDAMQGEYCDGFGAWHQEMADRIIANELQGYSVVKQYISEYPLDQFYEKPLAKEAIINSINNGVSLVLYSGHGSEQTITDEHVLTAESIDRISNDSMPFAFVGLTANNCSFTPSGMASMSMKYLFSPHKGAIIYFASPVGTAAAQNEALGTAIFSEAKKNPSLSFGQLVAKAKKVTANDINSVTFFLLGDPALCISTGVLPFSVKPIIDSIPSRLLVSIRGYSSINYSVSFTVRDSVFAAPAPAGVPDLSFSRDSVVEEVSGSFNDSVTITLPRGITVPVKATVYVWNDTADGRAELFFSRGSTNPVSWKPVRKIPLARPSVRRSRGRLIVTGLESGVNHVSIYNIMGKKIYAGEIAAGTGDISIDLDAHRLKTGQYVLQVRGRTEQTTLPFVCVAGKE